MAKKLTTKQFIEKAVKIHGNKYDYSLVNYKNSRSKVIIICKKHGSFEQKSEQHLQGKNCKKCIYELNTFSNEEFIEKAKIIHNNKFNYNLTNYTNSHTAITIECPIHGKFQQLPYTHISGSGCGKCGKNKKLTNKEFIEKANNIHNNMYDYSLINYKNYTTKIDIICRIHGVFQQKVANHLNGYGCKKCGTIKNSINRTSSTEEFINKAKIIHGDTFDYSKFEYIGSKVKSIIICKIHGEFLQKPNEHLNKKGCDKCGGTKTLTTKEFVKISKRTHGNKYDYSKVKYVNNRTKTMIICKIHGEFKQIPNSHLNGAGCPECSESHGEKKIKLFFNNKNINFTHQKRFKNCKYKKHLPFDFYLPDYNTCIEYDGKQHFESYEFWGGQKKLKETQRNDQIKNQFCKDNDIKLLRISYAEFKNIDNILTNYFNLNTIYTHGNKL